MNLNTKFLFKVLITSALVTTSISAHAQREGRFRESRSPRWHGGDIRHFEFHDRPLWRGGQWHHVVYGGHLGWWWVVGATWYPYPGPIYPYPDPYTPPTVVVQTAPQAPSTESTTQNWYYCEEKKEYYPYIQTCPSEWKVVPSKPSVDVGSPPPK